MFDSSNTKAYYSSWQLLLVVEVADTGIRFHINFAEDDERDRILEALQNRQIPDGCTVSTLDDPIRCMRSFDEHERTLDAVVWFAEETQRALNDITKYRSGRFLFTDDDYERYQDARRQNAFDSSTCHKTGLPKLVELCQFLALRWLHWDKLGRPLIADAYKDALADTVVMAQLLGDLDFPELCGLVGLRGHSGRSLLRTIWPDWRDDEKVRVTKTLRMQSRHDDCLLLEEHDIKDFVDFLADHYLETFFWRHKSFEQHAFSHHDFSLEAMQSDLQGMAVCVEHVVRALGGTDGQLYEMFKQLWQTKPEVLTLLKSNEVSQLARGSSKTKDWPNQKARIDALRADSETGQIVADLVMAHRIRGDVHHALLEDDSFELERLFVTLMRAAALTFKEVRRHEAERAAVVPKA